MADSGCHRLIALSKCEKNNQGSGSELVSTTKMITLLPSATQNAINKKIHSKYKAIKRRELKSVVELFAYGVN